MPSPATTAAPTDLVVAGERLEQQLARIRVHAPTDMAGQESMLFVRYQDHLRRARRRDELMASTGAVFAVAASSVPVVLWIAFPFAANGPAIGPGYVGILLGVLALPVFVWLHFRRLRTKWSGVDIDSLARERAYTDVASTEASDEMYSAVRMACRHRPDIAAAMAHWMRRGRRRTHEDCTLIAHAHDLAREVERLEDMHSAPRADHVGQHA